MKTIIYLILGILLGLFTLDLAINAIIALAHFQIITAAIFGAFGYLVGILAGKCFKEI